MKLPNGLFLLWLGLVGSLAQSDPSPKGEESYSDWGLRHLRGSFESVNSYVDSFMELLGGKNGICQYRCRYGKAPMPRPGYKPQEPNGCGSYFLGIKVPGSMDLGIPAMTKCCNQLDVCYDTCGANKYRCDAKFRWCLHSICSDLKRSLGFVSNVEEPELPGNWRYWTRKCLGEVSIQEHYPLSFACCHRVRRPFVSSLLSDSWFTSIHTHIPALRQGL
ncbi:group XIIB secretory phospholipase A2-like protein isoform X1 [Meriones unguiculatus]|uniref:group XIIB secretory phospholipase A2-like protein isoform X1 n=1 Tax=Meriones unguiculatus TaxID=10047 RepID=UPI000B4F24DF|nr:group XIIB secretory phospholipase A2-like protein isoform X1 [Meriones unguiculatus]